MLNPFVARLTLAALALGVGGEFATAQSPSLSEEPGRFVQPRVRTAPAPMPSEFDRPRLGVMVSDTPEGVLVTSVVEDGMAAAAGVQEGDIILSLDGQRLATYTEIGPILTRLGPGADVAVTVIREGSGLVKLEGRIPVPEPEKRAEQGMADGHRGGFLGVQLGSGSEEGVHVDGVVDGSAAWYVGLEEGDVLTAIDGKEVHSGEEVAGAISSRAPGTLVTIDFVRDDETLSRHVRVSHRSPPPFGNLGSLQTPTPDGFFWQHPQGAQPDGAWLAPTPFRGGGAALPQRVDPDGGLWKELRDQMRDAFSAPHAPGEVRQFRVEIKDGVMTIERDGQVQTVPLEDATPGQTQNMFFRVPSQGGTSGAWLIAPAAPASPHAHGVSGFHSIGNGVVRVSPGAQPTRVVIRGGACSSSASTTPDCSKTSQTPAATTSCAPSAAAPAAAPEPGVN